VLGSELTRNRETYGSADFPSGSKLKRQGRSVQETITANPSSSFDGKWAGLVPPEAFVELVYAGIK
jgi:hypothetical protein